MEYSKLQTPPGETPTPSCTGSDQSQGQRCAFLDRANAELAEGNISVAIGWLIKAAELPAPPEETARIYEQVGDLLFEHQRFHAAMAAYHQAVLHQPTDENRRKYDASIAARGHAPADDATPIVKPKQEVTSDEIQFPSFAAAKSFRYGNIRKPAANTAAPSVGQGEDEEDRPSLLERIRQLITPRRAYIFAAVSLVLFVCTWILAVHPFRRHPAPPVKSVTFDPEAAPETPPSPMSSTASSPASTAPAASSGPAEGPASTSSGVTTPAPSTTTGTTSAPASVPLPTLPPSPEGTDFPKRAVFRHHVPAPAPAPSVDDPVTPTGRE